MASLPPALLTLISQSRSLKPYAMVHIAFKTVYLFLAFLALPQALAAPVDGSDRRSPDDTVDIGHRDVHSINHSGSVGHFTKRALPTPADIARRDVYSVNHSGSVGHNTKRALPTAAPL